ncbi:MAG: winged helix-turn-helix transcriptional regulator [Xanthomonadales bacterium]|nr:winged helix-turn-helix transcriptional regulator [Xanthomonadales bacterium]
MSARSYGQNCSLAVAMDLIGERWTLLIVRELMLGPRRFTQLQENLPGIGTNLLSDRLARLTRLGILDRQRADGGHPSYSLSQIGKELEAVVYPLIRWGNLFPDRRRDSRHSRPEWNILPLRAYYSPRAGQRWKGAYRVEIDGQALTVAARETGLETVDDDPVATITMDSVTAAKVASGSVSLERAVQAGQISLAGSPADIELFFDAFSGPD